MRYKIKRVDPHEDGEGHVSAYVSKREIGKLPLMAG